MQQLRVSKKYVIAAALVFGFAGGAYAQSGLPPVQHQGAVSYVSGGVGLDESMAFRQSERSWPLALRFTGTDGEYLSDVQVSISAGKGDQVLSTDAQGPYMLVRLSPGRYTVHATYNGQTQDRSVTVPAKGGAKVGFRWQSL